jgi:hypothetical protein
MPDGPFSPEEIAEFLARCRAEWAERGLPLKAPQHVIDRVAAIVVASNQTKHTAA